MNSLYPLSKRKFVLSHLINLQKPNHAWLCPRLLRGCNFIHLHYLSWKFLNCNARGWALSYRINNKQFKILCCQTNECFFSHVQYIHHKGITSSKLKIFIILSNTHKIISESYMRILDMYIILKLLLTSKFHILY